MTNEEARVFIAILSLNKFIAAGIATRLLQWIHSKHCVCFITGVSPVDYARNHAAVEFLKTDCTHILYWDHDIIPPIDALDRLLAHDKDVISAMCPLYNKDHGICSASFIESKEASCGYVSHSGTGLEEVAVCTGGFFLVKRDVMQRIKRPFGFGYDKKGFRTCTEEFWFAEKVHKLGKRIYTDYDVKCEHLRQAQLLALTGTYVENV